LRTALVDQCRKEEITVNSALTTAIVGSQTIVQGEELFHSSISVAASVRDRLPRPDGEIMGFMLGWLLWNTDTIEARVFMGTAVPDLIRMDFPRKYGALELDRLIMKPGGGFPLAT
jgi:hypothetical protein